VQHLVVDGCCAFISASETIARLVDLRLGERLDDQEMSHRITRLAKLTVCGNDPLALDHALNLPRSRLHGFCRLH
jgi:hypothetical protein